MEQSGARPAEHVKKTSGGKAVEPGWNPADILKYEQVSIHYHGVPAVRQVSFTLRRGEVLGIAGESGSGKSTLIRAALGLLDSGGAVTEGRILFRGRNLADLSRRELRRISGPEIAMVFQDAGAAFCPVRTIGSQLFEAVREHRKADRAGLARTAAALFRRIGFENPERVLASYPFELSGGMRQRAGIAAAALLHPAVLLADEPTSALDVSVQKQVVEELLLIRKLYGAAMIVVTHNMGVLRRMADRVLVMKDGAAVEYGEREQVLERPAAAYTQKLMAAVPRLRLD